MSRRSRDRAVIPEMVRTVRGAMTRNEELICGITGSMDRKGIEHFAMLGWPVTWISGRHVVIYSPVVGEDGRVKDHPTDWTSILVRRRRVRIPKGHPWRGRRPTAELYGVDAAAEALTFETKSTFETTLAELFESLT